ncbi:MAG: SPOR domain-containing protein [Nitrospinota bacterium]
MKNHIRGLLLALLFTAVYFNTGALALGLGDIDVKRAYNKKFLASIPVYLGEDEEAFSAQIGSEADYALMRLVRPGFVDMIEITLRDDPQRPGQKRIVLTSPQPIVHPSFNLIIRATAGGGSILENYFLAVDFRKSLTLGLPEEEEVREERIGQEKGAMDGKEGTAKAVPAPTAELVETAKVEPEPRPQPAVKSGPVTDQVQTAKVEPESRPQPAISIRPVEGVSTREILKINSDPLKNTIFVKKGNTLYGLARKLGGGSKNLARIVAALYLENQRDFIGGNIHLLREGATLSYNHVNEIAGGISQNGANELIQRDWDLRQSARKAPLYIELPSPLKAVSGQELLDALNGWKKSWMAKDFDAFASFYSDDFVSPKGLAKKEWISYRKQWSRNKSDIKLVLEKINIARGGDTITVYFTQFFMSNRYNSAGLKRLVFKPTDDGPKISAEWFYQRRAVMGKNQWIIHVGTFGGKATSMAYIKRLRKAGFPAFEVNSYLKEGKTVYRVVIGRFASKAVARQTEMKLREWGEVYARVLKMAFAIKVAAFDNSTGAEDTLASLQKKGLSPYLHEKTRADKVIYGVYLGAFPSENEAEIIARRLKSKIYNIRVEAP